MGEFSEQVFAVVRRIPRGAVASYGQVARLVGKPRAARYVGYALHANPAPGDDAADIPCHRVVFKDGALCKGYAFGGPDVQRRMLEKEGVSFSDDDHVDMEACGWNPAQVSACDDDAMPLAPPADFDWERELAD